MDPGLLLGIIRRVAGPPEELTVDGMQWRELDPLSGRGREPVVGLR